VKGFDDGCSVRLLQQECLRCDKLFSGLASGKILKRFAEAFDDAKEGMARRTASAVRAANRSHVQPRSTEWTAD